MHNKEIIVWSKRCRSYPSIFFIRNASENTCIASMQKKSSGVGVAVGVTAGSYISIGVGSEADATSAA